MLGKIIGIVGALGMTAPALLGMRVRPGLPAPGGGTRPPITDGGLDTLQVQIVLGLAVLALVLMVLRARTAILPGILGLGVLAWYYVVEIMGSDAPAKLAPSAGNGLIIGGVGCVLVAIGAFLYKPKR